MGGLQALHKYVAVVVILVTFHEIVITTQGRQIKVINQHFLINNKDISFASNVPTSADIVVNSISSKDTNGDVSAYRPTTPGNSPGVGHKKSGVENGDTRAKDEVHQSPPEVEYFLDEGSKTDFRPTDPGHSPGVGHSAHENSNDGEVGLVKNQLRN